MHPPFINLLPWRHYKRKRHYYILTVSIFLIILISSFIIKFFYSLQANNEPAVLPDLKTDYQLNNKSSISAKKPVKSLIHVKFSQNELTEMRYCGRYQISDTARPCGLLISKSNQIFSACLNDFVFKEQLKVKLIQPKQIIFQNYQGQLIVIKR